MPTLDDIQKFNQILTSLGSEPELSEDIEYIPPPDQELSADLKNLLDTEQPSGESELAGEFAGDAGGLDLGSILGEEGQLGGLDELPLDMQEEEREEALPAAGLPGEETFSEPVSFEPGLPEEGEAEGVPTEAEEPFPSPEEAIEGFDMESFEEPGEELGEEDFKFPELDTSGFEEEPPGVQVPADEASADEAPAGETPGEEVDAGDLGEEGVSEGESPEIEFGEEFEIPVMETPSAAATETEAEAETEAGAGELSAEGETFQPPDGLLEGLDVDSFEESEPEAEGVQGIEEGLQGEQGIPETGLGEEDFQFPEVSPEEMGAGFPGEEALPELEPEEPGEIDISGQLEDMDEVEVTPTGGDEGDFTIDEFALPDVEGEAPSAPAGPELEKPAERPFEEAPIETAEEPLQEIMREYTEREFKAIQASLSSLPLNLKITIEELIGEKSITDQDQRKLLELLIRGNSAAELISFISKVSGKQVRLPKGFEKKTGLAFEVERGTFAYAFRENIVPILRVFIPAAVLAVLLGMAVNQIIVIPLRATSLYSRGYTLILQDRYQEANEMFDAALTVLPIKNWFYRYAERFVERKNIPRAEEKYEQLLSRREWRLDKKGILDFAALETDQAKFPEAEQLLKRLLDSDMYDYDALLASGDNYLEWAESEPEHYQQAHDLYARIVRGKDGSKDEPWFHMLRYYIRTDKLEEVEKVKNKFQKDRNLKIDPAVYAELAGYLITKGKLNDVKDILMRALKARTDLPETYYNFARYFQAINYTDKEVEALDFTQRYLEEAEPLTRKRLKIRINTYNRQGELFYGKEDFIKAEDAFQTAGSLIEEATARRLLPEDDPDFGKVFYNRGDVQYYVHRDLETAERMYEKAQATNYKNPELYYKLGYIRYAKGPEDGYQKALLDFYQIAALYSSNTNLLFSIANTLYKRNDFFAAQGYYNRLLDILQDRLGRIPLLRPSEEPEHKTLVQMLMRTYNNLGVTLKRLSESRRDPLKETEALVNFTTSSEYFDLLDRDPESMRKGEAKSLAYLNTRGILYPQSDFSLQIYSGIPKDLKSTQF